jgi:hypothetical protein
MWKFTLENLIKGDRKGTSQTNIPLEEHMYDKRALNLQMESCDISNEIFLSKKYR